MSKLRKKRPGPWIFSTLGVAILALLWVLFSLVAGSFIVPPPWTVLKELGCLCTDSHTWIQIAITLLRVGAGFLSAFITGTLIGILIGREEWLESMFRPALLFFQGIPPLLWAIPLILVFGVGSLSPILVIALICFPLVVVSIAQGMKTVPKELEEMVRVFAPGAYPWMREIIFPHLKPFFAASLRLGVTLGIKASVVGEYFGANNGIGFQIQAAYQSLRIRELFSWGLILVFLIVFSSRALQRLEKAGRASPPLSFGKRSLPPTESGDKKVEEILTAERRIAGITVENVSFSYPGEEKVLEDVHLSVALDETVIISGESGIGKTTLLKIIAGILQPETGSIEATGKIGFVFQDDRLIPWKSVLWNCAFPLYYQRYTRQNALLLARYLLSEVGLSGSENKLPQELSGGMRKRASLVRCFARIPEAILLDEPFSGLHREARCSLWAKFFSLVASHPVPVVIVTHFPEELEAFPNIVFYELRDKPAKIYRATESK